MENKRPRSKLMGY